MWGVIQQWLDSTMASTKWVLVAIAAVRCLWVVKLIGSMVQDGRGNELAVPGLVSLSITMDLIEAV